MFGEFGHLEVDTAAQRVRCHECGRWLRALPGRHLSGVHELTAEEYRRRYGLSGNNPLVAPAVSEAWSASLRRRIEEDPDLRESMEAQHRRAASGELGRRSGDVRRGNPLPAEHVRNAQNAVDRATAQQAAATRRADALAARHGFNDFATLYTDRRAGGLTHAQLASQLGVSPAWLTRQARRTTGPQGSAARRFEGLLARLTAQARDDGCDDLGDWLRCLHHDKRQGITALAERLGIATTTVHRVLHATGVPVFTAELEADAIAQRHGFDSWSAYVTARRAGGASLRVIAEETGRSVKWVRNRGTG